MIFLYLVLFVISIISAAEVQGKDCPYCAEHALRCTPGHVVQNACVRCVCAPDGTYLCNTTTCSDEQKENVILGKPTQATCAPQMLYVLGDVTCLCSRDGFWPHDKCEILFSSLHNKTSSRSQEPLKPKAQRCIPNSYFIHDCNVCKCSPEGEVERSRCTRNVCNEHTLRRSNDQVRGSCVTGTWYSLTPCQFCYCHTPNKLVCTANEDYKHIQIGEFNLTTCGKDLLNSIMEIIPNKIIQELGINVSAYSNVVPTNKATDLPSNKKQARNLQPLRVGDSEDDNNEPFHDNKMTVQPFSDSSEEKAQSVEKASEETYIDIEKKETDVKIPEKVEKKATRTKHVKIEKVQEIALEAPATPKAQKEKVSKIEISIPSVLQRILNFALRKSMVKVDVQNHCIPGSTTKDGCNFCFCLTSGKMLCSNRSCDTNQ